MLKCNTRTSARGSNSLGFERARCVLCWVSWVSGFIYWNSLFAVIFIVSSYMLLTGWCPRSLIVQPPIRCKLPLVIIR